MLDMEKELKLLDGIWETKVEWEEHYEEVKNTLFLEIEVDSLETVCHN